MLEKIGQNFDVEKELDRELELLKQLEFEQKTEEILNKIEKIKTKQQKIKEQNLETKLKKKTCINKIA